MSSSWKIEKPKSYPKLTKDLEVDVAIVGGGLAGIWCAYRLAEAGKSVAVLEKKRIGSGETEYTTAFLNQTIDTALVDLVKMFGQKSAKLVWQSHREAIGAIEEVARKERISCELKRAPVYVYARDEKEYKSLEEEHKVAKSLGFATAMTTDTLPGMEIYGYMTIKDQAKYHPMKFLYGLAGAAEKKGAQIFENTEVKEVSSRGTPKVFLKNGATVTAKYVIIATYDPLGNPQATKFKKGMYTSYVYELLIPKTALPEAMFLDLHNPYHYVRVDRIGEEARMIVGGEDHRAELKVPEGKNFKALREFIDETFPDLKYKISKRWSGAILEPSDGLALIGKYGASRYVACAFSGNGMTYSAITGRLLTDLILSRVNPYAELYDPRRKMRIKALATKFRDYSGEFAGGAGKNIWKRT